MRFLSCIRLAGILSLAAGAAMALAPAVDGAAPAIVTVEVYSGRPNPRWTLAPAQQRELDERLAALPVETIDIPIDDGLGYRHVRAEFPGRFVVYASPARGVTVEGEGLTRHYRDPDRGFEFWLLGTGGDALSPALLGRIKRGNEAAPPP